MAHHSAAKPDLDVLIVGAGISGVSAAYHLQKRCPDKSYAILERRDAVGGTWDLFRYPGIRSDSDMYTLGFRFKPWEKQKAIADGHLIKKYVEETVDEEDIRKNIRFGRKVIDARWSSRHALWTVEAVNEATGETEQTTARFIAMCAGYYNYDAGYTPEFEGVDSFEGQLIHPQQWPEDLDYAGKRVVVIGSGATAVTIVPVMAETAGHVTMLQRSPTYMISRSVKDKFALTLRKFLPAKLAYGIVRWRNVVLQQFFFKMARNKPVKVKEKLLKAVRAKLPEGYDVETHFTPRYNPWEERLCLVPDNDMFHAISSGKASVATDHIERFSPEGLKLKSGRTLAADIVVTATGLDLQTLGGAELTVDGRKVEPRDITIYKGMMYSNVPNMIFTFGYTNASWTLKADLVSEYLCRILKHMDRSGAVQATPRLTDPNIDREPFADFSSGYFKRAEHKMPKQGVEKPWRLHQDYAVDMMNLRFGGLEDEVMEFRGPEAENAPDGAPALSAAE